MVRAAEAKARDRKVAPGQFNQGCSFLEWLGQLFVGHQCSVFATVALGITTSGEP